MKRTFLICMACVAACLPLVVARGEPAEVPLQTELAHAREAWLHHERPEVLARVAGLHQDARVADQLQRWYAGMQAWMLLEAGDADAALELLRDDALKRADVRPTVSAVRVLVTFGHVEHALRLVRSVREEQPHSRALERTEAGLELIAGRHDRALAHYLRIIADDTREGYPYVRIEQAPWGSVTEWPTAETAAREPQTGLFGPVHWYFSDLPGLDRCILELAADDGHAAVFRQRLDAELDSAQQAQRRLVLARTADEETRTQAARQAREAVASACVSARVVATADLAAGRNSEAAAAVARALQIAPDNVALLDLQAQALGAQGLAEEVRVGPISRMRARAGLRIDTQAYSARGPSAQRLDRIFTGAAKLAQVNPDAGRKQLDALVEMFPSPNNVQGQTEGALGVWLYRRGMHDLARHYLRRASLGFGADRTGALIDGALVGELYLAVLGVHGGTDQVQPGGEPAIGQGIVPENAPALVHQAARAGRVLSAVCDARQIMQDVAGVEVWGFQPKAWELFVAGLLYADVREHMQALLYDMPRTVAEGVPAEELAALLKPESAYSQAIERGLTGFAGSLRDYRSSRNWQMRQRVSNDAEAALGLIEGRVTLLRASLLQAPPPDMQALAEYLRPHVRQLDLRALSQFELPDRARQVREERLAAGVAYVPHTGLLLTCVEVLARAGHGADAARLVWHNRDASMGLPTMSLLLHLGAALAKDDPALSALMRLSAGSDRARGNVRLMLEFRDSVRVMQELASEEDLHNLIDDLYMPWLSTREAAWLTRDYPGFASYPPERLYLAAPVATAERMLYVSVDEGSAREVMYRWFRLARAPGHSRMLFRMASWALLCDLGFEEAEYIGHARPADVAQGWRLLRDACERYPEAAAARGLSAEWLAELQRRCVSVGDQLVHTFPTDWD